MKKHLAKVYENLTEALLIVVAILSSISNTYTVLLLFIVLILKLFMMRESVIKHD